MDLFNGIPVWTVVLIFGGSILAVIWGFYRWDKNLTIVLTVCALAGGLRAFPVSSERNATNRIVRDLSGEKNYKIRGVVDDIPGGESGLILLRSCEVYREGSFVFIPGRLRCYVSEKIPEFMKPGASITCFGKIGTISELKNFYGFRAEKYYHSRRIYGNVIPIVGSFRQVEAAGGIVSVYQRMKYYVRGRTIRIIRGAMPTQEGRLMQAMLFNDMEILSAADTKIFRDSNTLHLFVVSGMHVMILAYALNMTFESLRLGRRNAWIATLLVMLFYLSLIGFVTSAVRAVIMAAAVTMGNFLRREVDPLSSLLSACFLMVAFDPLVLWQVGFVLSVLCVLAMLIFIPLFEIWFVPNRKTKLTKGKLGSITYLIKDKLVEPLLAVLAISVVLMPTQLFLFHKFNLLSIMANVVQSALATLLLVSGMLVIVAGWIWIPAAKALGAAGALLMKWVYGVSEITASFDWANIRVGGFSFELLLLVYAILFGGYYMRFRSTPEFAVKSRNRFAVHYACILSLLFFPDIRGVISRRDMVIYFFDVGQGDSTFIKFPGGKTMLIDGGKNEPDMGRLVVVPQLQALGVTKIDWVVATHFDSDHIGGLSSVFREFPVGKLMIPDFSPTNDKLARQMIDLARAERIPVLAMNDSFVFSDGKLSVRALNPRAEITIGNSSDNDRSIVLEIRYGNFSAVLTGDAGKTAENLMVANGELQETTVLKLGHHGSRFSSGEEFVAKLRPKIGIASCGARNNFGHPNKAVIERVEKHGGTVYRTDKNGAIRLVTDGEKIELEPVVMTGE